jgi:hypothetical protein
MDSCVRRIRCLRCGCPSPDHPNANKYGGVSMASDTLCVACKDRLARKGPVHLMHYRVQQNGIQRKLGGFS